MMKSVFLEKTENVSRFVSAMEVLSDTEKGQPGLGVVWGRAGRGKTITSQWYAAENDSAYLRVLQDWTPAAMMRVLCREVHGARPRFLETAKGLVIETLEREPRIVFVDEADRLRPGLIEHLRDVHDLSGAPVVLIGEENLFTRLEAHRRLWSRVTRRVHFGEVTPDDAALFALESAGLRLDKAAARRVAKAAEGDFRLVYRIVQELEQMAKASGKSEVDSMMADAAWRLNRPGRTAA